MIRQSSGTMRKSGLSPITDSRDAHLENAGNISAVHQGITIENRFFFHLLYRATSIRSCWAGARLRIFVLFARGRFHLTRFRKQARFCITLQRSGGLTRLISSPPGVRVGHHTRSHHRDVWKAPLLDPSPLDQAYSKTRGIYNS